MRRRSKFKFLGFSSLIATLLIGSGFAIHSISGEIQEKINESKIEQELEDTSAYEIPIFESETEKADSKEKVIETFKEVGKIVEETVKEQIDSIPEPEEVVVRREISDELLRSGYEFKNIDFAEKQARNPDVNAWITIDGTNIDYEIMYAPDKEDNYYLHRDIDGNESTSGLPYLFSANRSLNNYEDDISDVSIIFSHHMRGGKMFAQICNYVNQSYYDAHPYGVIYTPDGYAYKLSFFAGKVFSGSNNKDVYAVDYINEEIFNNVVEFAKTDSTFESDFEVKFGDKIMILVTCEYTGGTNSRYALYGVMEKQYTNELQISNNEEAIRRSR